jgi:anti-sigma regulatory factor (Ser/Thr protein kinase)
MEAENDAGELRLILEARPDAVGRARKAVTEFAELTLPGHRAADLALVVSEIVTNAIRHGRAEGAIELRAVSSDEHLRVEVTDTGAGPASAPRSTESSPEGGFGLFLVEHLSHRWGLVRHAATTRVWFEFQREPRFD